jgi:glycosyltransferase involved in cell wall biosynthesis
MLPIASPRLPAEPRRDDAPLVSIVTPSFNQGRFLRRTIDSVLGQDYPHVEYLVIDGGSTDESLAILRQFGPRVRWISEPDRGQSDALNKGFARCRGELRAFLNSDDVLRPGAIRTAVEYFRRQPDWDLLYGNADHITADDHRIAPYPTASFDLDRLRENCFICQPATFWRTRLAETVGPFDVGLHYALDLDYWLRAARAGARLVHVPEVLAASRVYPETKTLSCREAMYREILAVCQRHAGGAGFSQYFAYWHHRCREAARGWPSRFPRRPRAEYWLALLHYRWDRSGRAPAPFLAAALTSLISRVAWK